MSKSKTRKKTVSELYNEYSFHIGGMRRSELEDEFFEMCDEVEVQGLQAVYPHMDGFTGNSSDEVRSMLLDYFEGKQEGRTKFKE
jgi:hypothetical protein